MGLTNGFGLPHTVNLQLVQDLYDAFSRRDMAAILAVLSPEVVWAEPAHPFNPCGGTRRGHAGLLERARIGSQEEDILLLEPRLFLTADDHVAVVGHTLSPEINRQEICD
jgi:ketosteroid isomerase-like protein